MESGLQNCKRLESRHLQLNIYSHRFRTVKIQTGSWLWTRVPISNSLRDGYFSSNSTITDKTLTSDSGILTFVSCVIDFSNMSQDLKISESGISFRFLSVYQDHFAKIPRITPYSPSWIHGRPRHPESQGSVKRADHEIRMHFHLR